MHFCPNLRVAVFSYPVEGQVFPNAWWTFRLQKIMFSPRLLPATPFQPRCAPLLCFLEKSTVRTEMITI